MRLHGGQVLLTTNHRPEIAEALGVYLLVLAGCGAIVVNALTGALANVGVALTFGFAIIALVHAMAHICSAHYDHVEARVLSLLDEHGISRAS